jgi:hypothetical protein
LGLFFISRREAPDDHRAEADRHQGHCRRDDRVAINDITVSLSRSSDALSSFRLATSSS